MLRRRAATSCVLVCPPVSTPQSVTTLTDSGENRLPMAADTSLQSRGCVGQQTHTRTCRALVAVGAQSSRKGRYGLRIPTIAPVCEPHKPVQCPGGTENQCDNCLVPVQRVQEVRMVKDQRAVDNHVCIDASCTPSAAMACRTALFQASASPQKTINCYSQ
jgi:hypothetical protein